MTVVYHRPPRTTITTSIPAAPANGDLASSHHQRHVRTTSQGLRDRSDPRARPHRARMRKWSAVAPKPSRCRIAYNRRTRKSSKEIREAVSDRGGGVRSRGERPPTRGAPNDKGTAIMKLTTTTQVSIDGVVQGTAGRMRTAAADSSEADEPGHRSTARP